MGHICQTRTTTPAVLPFPRTRSHPTAYTFPVGSCRRAATLKPWGAFPTSTSSRPMRSDGCAAWPATTPMTFNSNPASWPLIATQHNDFKEVYFNGSASIHRGRHEFKVGVESDNDLPARKHRLRDALLRRDLYEPSMPDKFGHLRHRRDHLCLYRHPPGSRTSRLCSGLNSPRQLDGQRRPAMGPLPIAGEPKRGEPRIAVSRYFPKLSLNIHGSFDRIFQTPSFENILLSSSPEAADLDTSGARGAIAGPAFSRGLL